MKRAFYLMVLLPILIALTASCTKDFEEINTSPNNATVASTPYILTYVEANLGSYFFDEWRAGRQAWLFSQHMSQTNYTTEDRYTLRVNVTSTYFKNMYVAIQALQDIIRLNGDAKTAKTVADDGGENAMQVATARILKAYAIEHLAESFGPIPYSQACQLEKFQFPKYDSEEEIFAQLWVELSESVNALKSCTKGWTKGDILFAGDIQKWIRFGNTLRLRVALRQSNVNPNWKTLAQQAIADGIMESNADNAGVHFDGSSEINQPHFYRMFVNNMRADYTLTRGFVLLLRGFNDTLRGWENPFHDIVDPRLVRYIGQANVAGGFLEGMPYGIPTGQAAPYNKRATTIKLKNTQLFDTINKKTLDFPPSSILSNRLPNYLLDYPIACFMRAEVEGNSAEWFRKGVEASLALWEAEASVSNAYLTEVLGRFNTATEEKKYEMILTQKYIHTFNNSFEAWAEYRRTGYPGSVIKPGEKSYMPIVSEDGQSVLWDGIFTPLTPYSAPWPIARIAYDLDEKTMNSASYKAAVATLERGDTNESRLWWAKK